MRQPADRFADRVEAYVKFRPGYPEALFSTLVEATGLQADSVVADLGSGTGILTAGLLERFGVVHAVEPNAPMREAAEALLGGRPGFRSHPGTAEETGLADDSVDLVVAAQAFHWFNRETCSREFRRILKRGGHTALIWNERIVDATPFLRDYEVFLHQHGTDYASVNHALIDRTEIERFFHPEKISLTSFPNRQDFDWEGLKGRCLSCSYIPNVDDSGYEPMISALRSLFEQHRERGRVAFLYNTQLFLSRNGEKPS